MTRFCNFFLTGKIHIQLSNLIQNLKTQKILESKTYAAYQKI